LSAVPSFRQEARWANLVCTAFSVDIGGAADIVVALRERARASLSGHWLLAGSIVVPSRQPWLRPAWALQHPRRRAWPHRRSRLDECGKTA